MPVKFGSILHLNNSASEATLDASNLRGTTIQIDDFTSSSLATIGSGLVTAPGKRRLGTIVSTTGSADKLPEYYQYLLFVAVTASFGIRGADKLMKMKK